MRPPIQSKPKIDAAKSREQQVCSPLSKLPVIFLGHFWEGPLPIVTEENGAPAQIRTGDPLLRRQTLYPTELRARWLLDFNGFARKTNTVLRAGNARL
jgi:hypothetical protein